MSVVPTKIVEGDVAVGRNVTAGGDATVRGHAKVDKNLRVGGWLDARHVKRDCRGLYLNGDQLRREQAEPLPGWWAIVGGQVPGPLWHAEKSEESGRYEWVPVLDENGEPVIGGYTEVDTNPLLEDWNRLDERINQEAEDRQTGDAGLLKLIQTEAGVRQEADTFIEAKADTAIQLGNTANAANSRQDGEIATLQKALAGVTESLDLYALKEDGIPHFDAFVDSEDNIKAGGIYFYNGKFYTRNNDDEVVLYEPYMAGSKIQTGVYRCAINLYQAVYTRKPNKPGQKPAPYLLQFTELRWIDPSEILEVSMYDDEADPFDPSKSYYFTNLASADYAAIQKRMKRAGELTVMMNLRLLDNTGEAIATLPVSVTDTSEDAIAGSTYADYEMYGLFIYQNKLWNLYVDVCQEGSDVTVELREEYCADKFSKLAETVEEMGQKVAKASELRYFDAILPDTVPGQLDVMTLPTGAVYFRDGAFWINQEDNHKTPHPEYNHKYDGDDYRDDEPGPNGTTIIGQPYSLTALPGIYCMRGGAFSVADELYFCLVKGTDKQGYATTLISLSSIKNMIGDGEATDEDVDTAADEVFGAIETETT